MAVGERYFLVSASGERAEVAHNTIVGRNSSCEINIDDSRVSRHHARFLVSDEGLSLVDLTSRNGTFVQDIPVEGTQLLHHGESIRFGSFSYTLESQQQSDGNPTAVHYPDATIVRPVGMPKKAEDKPPEQGSIVVMPRYENLPPAWVYDDDEHTRYLKLSDMERLALEQEQASLDLSVFEANIDAPTLVVATGIEAGTSYKLQMSSAESFWTIGKGSENLSVSIVIDDISVSTLHAKLSNQGDRWKIADQMSTNKTYVNGEQFNSAFLSSRDVVRLGSVSLLFLLPANPDAEQNSVQAKKSLWGNIKRFFKL